MLCFSVKRKISLSCPIQPVAAVATEMLCGEIILPATPPVELAATVRCGSIPSCSAAVFCKLPNRALDEVSEPVRHTPIQPRIGAKNGKKCPVLVNARPRVALMPA